jgi:hypothetical protein
MDHVGNANPTRFCNAFETGGNVDAITVYIVALDDNVTEMDPDAKPQLSVFGLVPVSPRSATLDVDSAVNRIDDAAELDQEPVAHGFDQAAPVFTDGRVNDLVELIVETGARSRLIVSHESAVADHIGSQDCCQPPLDALFGHADRSLPDAW